MGGDDPHVGQQRAHALGQGRRVSGTDLAWAEVGDRLLRVDRVRPAQQREEIARVVGDDRQRGAARALAGEQRRDRELGQLVNGAGVAKPVRAPRQAGEVGVADGIDPAVRPQQRCEGELVEDHHDHRGGGLHASERLGVVPAQERRDRREEQEQGAEHDRRRGKDAEERPDRLRARVEKRDARAHQQRRRDDHRAGRSSPLQRLQHDHAGEQRDEAQVQDAPQPGIDQPGHALRDQEGQWRQDHQAQSQQHDVDRLGSADRKKRRAVGQELVERLGEGERAQNDDVNPVDRDPSPVGSGVCRRRRSTTPCSISGPPRPRCARSSLPGGR